jgi:hypothetical protein
MPPEMPEPLRALRDTWRRVVARPRRHFAIASSLLCGTVALFIARVGTWQTRLLAVGITAAFGGVWLARRRHERHVFSDAKKTIEHVTGHADKELADRAIRALSLLTEAPSQGTSSELAALHVRRALVALPTSSVEKAASRIAFLTATGAAIFATANLATCASNPWGVAEGLDVLLAQRGVAPVGMAWLANAQWRARPPDYLHAEERKLATDSTVELPRGTLLTLRGTPVHDGRLLLLSNGTTSVPFVDDGNGHVVARWPLADTVDLRVVARFGNVVIPDANLTRVTSIPDETPVVTLEGAPKRILLASEGSPPDVAIRYEATDDHGLREVHLVLRAGAREERRLLARLDGETRSDRGGHSLRIDDPFIKKSHAPVEVRVEAKDNDPVTGPKWGTSEAFTIVPPDVGEPEARRLAALVRVRDAVVEGLAWRIAHAVPGEPEERRDFLAHEEQIESENAALLESVVAASYAGVRVPGRVDAMIRARARKAKEAVTNERLSPSSKAHAVVVTATERLALVVDAVVHGQAQKDVRQIAKELADIADDLAAAATLSQNPSAKARAEERMDATALVLGGGGASLMKLGSLGRDLGEIVTMDLARISRARKDRDPLHASLAAQDLAARLRQPDPSFGAHGTRPSTGGGDSAGTAGTGESDGDTGDVEQAFREAARELEKLTADHGAHIGKVEQALAGATHEEDRAALAEEGKKHAANVREAADPLPTVGGGSDSWSSKAAAAREHAEQMAKALSQGNAGDAVESGKNANSALDEAKRALQHEPRRSSSRGGAAERTIDNARKTLDAELKWAEEKLAMLRQQAERRAGPELRADGETEGNLASRARDVSKQGKEREALPPAALEALESASRAADEAAMALREGNAQKGLQRQREAQQKLESAKEALGENEGERDQGNSERTPSNDHAAIPKADAHKGPEDFRKRVVKGLGQPSSGQLKEAIKRYAEGLLR